MKYNVITAGLLGVLIERVNIALKDGWKPQGGLVTKGDAFAQAMFKQL